MNLTESDINHLVDSYKVRLQKAAQKLESPAPSLSEIQDWMQKENVSSPEVLKLIISKIGKGEKSEKKMS